MESSDRIKILLVGDYLIFRTGLKMLLETEPAFSVVGEAANIAEASELVGRGKPDLMLVDSPEIDCPDFQNFIALKTGGIPFVVLAASKDEAMFRKCFGLGASGLISKESSSEDLFRALVEVNSGELWFDRRLMGQTIRQLMSERTMGRDGGLLTSCPTLTDREREVLALICRGFKNRAVAESLFISETTVRHHLTSIFEKLAVSTRLQLVVLAFREKLVDVPARNVDVELSLG